MKLGLLIRRNKLMQWLVDDAGLTENAVDVMISNGTIPREYHPHPRAKKASSKKASKQRPKPAEKQQPVLIDGRAWYRPKVIAQRLKIDLPQ